MGTHPIFESDFDCLTDMRLLSSVLAATAAAESASLEIRANQTILFINMNIANIEMKMGDFRQYTPLNATNWNWTFLDDMDKSEAQEVLDLFDMDEAQSTLNYLTNRIEGFQYFLDCKPSADENGDFVMPENHGFWGRIVNFFGRLFQQKRRCIITIFIKVFLT